MSYPNQKRITIGNRAKRSKDNLYATINLEALQQAMISLNGSSGLLLWLYLDKNQEGYSFDLSQKVCAEWGIKRDSYYRAVRELQDKGYLRISGKSYEFYEFADNHTDCTDNQCDTVHTQQRNNTYTTDNTYEVIPEEIYQSLMDKPTDLGNGLVKLSNGRIFKREGYTPEGSTDQS